jgi:kynurenine formamidase
MPSRLIDLSHPIENGMAVFPGLPGPKIRPLVTHEESRPRYGGMAEFQFDLVEMVGNVGTYLDAPRHRHRSGDDLASLSLDRLAALPGIALDGAARAVRSRSLPVRTRSEAGRSW